MIKTGILVLLSSIICFFLITCSGNEQKVDEIQQTEQEKKIDSLFNDLKEDSTSLKPVIEFKKPEMKEEIKKVLEKRTLNSEFNTIECCIDEETKIDKCCCLEVSVVYSEILSNDFDKSVRLNEIDPILLPCKKAFSSIFYEVEKTTLQTEDTNNDDFD